MSYTYIDDYLDDAAPIAIAPKHPAAPYGRFGKRLLDIVIVLVALPIVLPVILIAWALMSLNGGRGFYRQARIGYRGKVFMCWKIRTMERSADAILSQYIANDPALAAEWHRTQKLANDPRITRLGNILRRTSIDELPQIWNVLKGDMSLIGPRPFTPDQKELYDRGSSTRAYYRLRPGISGLWQVRSRNRGVFRDRIAFDEAYGADLSFIGDLRILLATVMVVLRATGK